jgi:hypothetical protein
MCNQSIRLVLSYLSLQPFLLTCMRQIKSAIPPANERKKLVPLAMMFFCILFNYTILRDTKDVLMVTAPKSGAEVIPFIKTYVNLPTAIVSLKRPPLHLQYSYILIVSYF